MNNRV